MNHLSLRHGLWLLVVLTSHSLAGFFRDLPADHWAYEAIEEAARMGLLEGYPDGSFLGGRNITRYEAAMILARIVHSPSDGSDVAAVAGDREALEDFRKRIAARLAALQEEERILTERADALEARVTKISKTSLDIGGSLQVRAWRFAPKMKNLFKGAPQGAKGGVDQHLILNLRQRVTGGYRVYLTLAGRRWLNEANFALGSPVIFLSRGWGEEESEILSLQEAYVEGNTSIGRLRLGRQRFQFGPIGLLFSANVTGPHQLGAAQWEYGDENILLSTVYGEGITASRKRVGAARLEFFPGTKTVLGVNYLAAGTDGTEDLIGADLTLHLPHGRTLTLETMRFRAPAGEREKNMAADALLTAAEDHELHLLYTDISPKYANQLSALGVEGHQGVYRRAFRGFGLSAWQRLSKKWELEFETNRGDNGSPARFARGRLIYDLGAGSTLTIEGIHFGESSATRQLVGSFAVRTEF